MVKGVFLVEATEETVYRLVYGSSKTDVENKFRFVYFDRDILSVEASDIIHINLPLS